MENWKSQFSLATILILFAAIFFSLRYYFPHCMLLFKKSKVKICGVDVFLICYTLSVIVDSLSCRCACKGTWLN